MKNVVNYSIMILLLILVFSDYLASTVAPFFSYTDETLMAYITLLAIFRIVANGGKVNILRSEKYIVCIYVILFIVGILGNSLSRYQSNNYAIFIDSISFFKFFWTYVFSIIWFQNDYSKSLDFSVKKFPKLLVYISIFVEICNIFIGTFVYEIDRKTGIKVFSFGGHAYFASAILACVIAVLMVNFKTNKLYIVVCLAILALTMRAKAFGYIALVILSIIVFSKRVKIRNLILATIAMLIVAREKIAFYFFSADGMRGKLLNASIEIAKSFFPIGSGFATFGTLSSGQFYSKAYYLYGFYTYWGTSKEHYGFITDGGWASIIGQLGFLGLILYCCMFIFMIFSIKYRAKISTKIPFVLLIGYIIIASTNENSLNSNYTVMFAIYTAIVSIYGKQKGEKEYE